jgi:hypothetical protein
MSKPPRLLPNIFCNVTFWRLAAVPFLAVVNERLKPSLAEFVKPKGFDVVVYPYHLIVLDAATARMAFR